MTWLQSPSSDSCKAKVSAQPTRGYRLLGFFFAFEGLDQQMVSGPEKIVVRAPVLILRDRIAQLPFRRTELLCSEQRGAQSDLVHHGASHRVAAITVTYRFAAGPAMRQPPVGAQHLIFAASARRSSFDIPRPISRNAAPRRSPATTVRREPQPAESPVIHAMPLLKSSRNTDAASARG